MKTKLTLALAALAFSGSALAQSAPSWLGQDSFNLPIGGEIAAQCSLGVNPQAIAQDLDLSPGAGAQTVASVTLWCNTGQGTAQVTYASQNEGLQHNSLSDRIDYQLSVSGSTGSFLVTSGDSSRTWPQVTGNINVGPQTRSVSVDPQTSLMTPAGEYSDVIAISVAAN